MDTSLTSFFDTSNSDFLNIINSTSLSRNHRDFFFSEAIDFQNITNIYHLMWDIIHSFHKEDSNIQIILFTGILKMFSRLKINCSCATSAIEIFQGLTSGNLNNFLNFKNKKLFWIIFHNYVNLKLKKDIFKIEF